MNFSLLHSLFHVTMYKCIGVFSSVDKSDWCAVVFVGDASTYQSDHCLFCARGLVFIPYEVFTITSEIIGS